MSGFSIGRVSVLRRVIALAMGVLLLGVAGLTESAAATGPAVAPRGACTISSSAAADKPTPFDGICDYLDGREGVVQAALFDEKTGRSYVLSNGDAPQFRQGRHPGQVAPSLPKARGQDPGRNPLLDQVPDAEDDRGQR